MKITKDITRRLGIRSLEDCLYFIGMLVIIIYLLTVSILSFQHILNPLFSYYPRFILIPSGIHFPILMRIGLGLMYISFLDWLVIVMARILVHPPPKNNKIDRFESLVVSVLIPAHNESAVIDNILGDLNRQSYKSLEIIVIAHNCTDNTAQKVHLWQKKDRRIKLIEYKTDIGRKALALNKGLEKARGSIIVNFDTDNRIPDKDFMIKLVQYFKDISVDGVQVSLGVTNHKNDLLTMFQRMEFNTFMNIFWLGRQYLGLPCFLAGTGTAMRSNVLHRYGGWDKDSLVEDFELFVKLSLAKVKIVYARELQVLDEKPVYWTQLIRQRARWFRGYIIVGIKYLFRFDNVIDYLYRLFPLSIFAWWITTFLYIYYFLSGQVSLININSWIWVSWTLVIAVSLFISSWPYQKFKTFILLPLYWFFTYHLVLVAIASLFVQGWHHTEHFGKEA